MERNLNMVKCLPCRPTRTCRYSAGPDELHLIATASASSSGDSSTTSSSATTRSATIFALRARPAPTGAVTCSRVSPAALPRPTRREATSIMPGSTDSSRPDSCTAQLSRRSRSPDREAPAAMKTLSAPSPAAAASRVSASSASLAASTAGSAAWSAAPSRGASASRPPITVPCTGSPAPTRQAPTTTYSWWVWVASRSTTASTAAGVPTSSTRRTAVPIRCIRNIRRCVSFRRMHVISSRNPLAISEGPGSSESSK